jgi:DNA-binding MarR family transcriptional regulator
LPQPRRTRTEATEALVAVAPLATRWIERLLANHDPPLTVAQHLALRAVAAGGFSATELARRTGVSGPAVSQLLTALGDAGLIERRTAPSDRRSQEVALTRAGQHAFRSADALLRRELGALLAQLPPPEADALARSLPHLEAALSGTPPPRRAPPAPPHPHRRPGRRRP